jgi:hypothetical protein
MRPPGRARPPEAAFARIPTDKVADMPTALITGASGIVATPLDGHLHQIVIRQR